jgi:hypothetical protein
MTEKLETVLDKVSSIANPVNSSLIQDFYQYMVDNRKSDSYKKNNLKALVLFSQELAAHTCTRTKGPWHNHKILWMLKYTHL